MAIDVAIVRATEAHAEQLAATMRAADAAEVRAAGLEPLEALIGSLRRSEEAEALLFDGQVAALFGVAPSGQPGLGVMWLLSGDAVDLHPLTYLRVSKELLAISLQRWERLHNMVDARHAAALRWVRWLGFTVHDAVPWGPLGMLFHPIEIRRPAHG